MALLLSKEEIESISKNIMTGVFRTSISRMYSLTSCLEKLESEDDRQYCLEFFLRNFGRWPLSDEVMRERDMSRVDFESIASKIGEDLIFAFREWTRKNISESELARRVYKRVWELNSPEEKAVALSLIFFSKDLVPYQQIPFEESFGFRLKDVVNLESDPKIQDAQSKKAVLIRNVVLRCSKSRLNAALVWKQIEGETSEEEKFMIFLRVWDALEEFYTTSGSAGWQEICELVCDSARG